MARERKKPTKKSTPPAPTAPLVPGASTALPAGYVELLDDLKARIRTAQVRASLAVNRELIALHWNIGKAIVERQDREGWGKSVVDQLATDLRQEFSGLTGFSPRNIWRMRAFYLAYPHPDIAILPQAVAEIPWGHNILLVEKLKESATRLWYAKKAVENGWSRNVLALQIDSKLHERQGNAVHNFHRTLPAPDSDLAAQLLKDPYTFDFLTLADDARERDLERGLLAHIRQFMLELGVGFAFVGSQYRLEVAGEDFFIDLLFYHCKLHCY